MSIACPSCGHLDDRILDLREVAGGIARGWWLLCLGLALGASLGLGRAWYIGGHFEAKVVVAGITDDQRAIATASGLRERMEGPIARFYLDGGEGVGDELAARLVAVMDSWTVHREARLAAALGDAERRGLPVAELYARYYRPLPWIIGAPTVRYVGAPLVYGVTFGIVGLVGSFLLVLLRLGWREK